MYQYLIIGFISVLLCYNTRDKNKGLAWAFFLITAFLSIRYMWGSDYPAYLQIYHEYDGISDFSKAGDVDSVVGSHNEIGWGYLNMVAHFLHIGFFGLVIVLTIFECWVVHRMIEKYVPQQYYWVAVMIWYFNTQSFCVNASMMRQYLCMCIYLLVIDLMIEKRVKGYILISVGIILLEATIHRSSIIQLLSLPLFYINFNTNKKYSIWMVIFGGVFIIWSIFGRGWIEPYMVSFLEESDDYSSYMAYLGKSQSGSFSSGLGVMFRYMMFATWLWFLPKIEKKRQPIVLLIIISYFFEVIATIAPIAGRLGLYFSFLGMTCWAFLYDKAKKKPILFVLFAIEIMILVRTIPQFFYSDLWMSSFLKYQTIFSAPSWM